MKPTIGLTTYHVNAHEHLNGRVRGMVDQNMLMSTMDYSECVKRAGGIPVAIPLIMDDDYIEAIVDKMDGFLFTGGSDIHPKHYDEELHKNIDHINTKRDMFELKLLKAVLKRDKPILGICRGCQLINVHFGGNLYQDIYSQLDTDLKHMSNILPRYEVSHKIKIVEDSSLYEAFGQKEIWVNSVHHQSLKKLGKGIKKIAWASDNIIEAIEHKGYKFVLGVQWHPEMMSKVHRKQLEVFKLLINKSI
ncbi:gamma-glutamyl-gamma-aminobutyrate hydrolase family protein [Anaeromicrobium sediminis]|uniref:Uncharacterized protein n=1 Tax=Anaeromicrobium sediminis TaxID=1478221 RepID=A0A267MIZ8_9FIRM|nr:gamma-glutamyl-gamma-aminobutyrate hydrolase family protein [Anaeromicrobium sediminis]PAB59561.1 hypothetical protein CCE28_10130 [Anaeromicrobium sediminis]